MLDTFNVAKLAFAAKDYLARLRTAPMQILKTNLLPAMLIVAALALGGCSPSPSPENTSKVAQAMQERLSADFAQYEFTVRPHGADLAPSLVYEGKNSTILVTLKPRLEEPPYGSSTVVIDGLARTRNGRYFTFSYRSQLVVRSKSLWSMDDLCTKQQECRYFGDDRPLTEDQAKFWLFESDDFTPERYKVIFNETPPAKRVPA